MPDGFIPIALCSATLTTLLDASVGKLCNLSFQNDAEATTLLGHIYDVKGGRIGIQLAAPPPRKALPQVAVRVPSEGIEFESLVLYRPSPKELLLSYPLWLNTRERREADRINLTLSCRFLSLEVADPSWQNCTLINMSRLGCCFVGPVSLATGTPFFLRLTVPDHPLSLLVEAETVWSIPQGNSITTGAEFQYLSLQAEATLDRMLARLGYPHPSSGREIW